MFKKVCIIGCGLIGSSLARAIKKNNLSKKIVSSNRSDVTNNKVIELKIVDDSHSDIDWSAFHKHILGLSKAMVGLRMLLLSYESRN